MKKLFCLFAFTSLFAVSCSDSDDNPSGPENPDPVANRLIQEIDTYEDGTSTTYTYTYDGDKLDKIIGSDGGIEDITYTGNKITKIEFLQGSTLEQSDLFEYDSEGRVIRLIRLFHDDASADRYEFVYNSDGTVSKSEFSGDHETQTFLQATSVITVLENGEVATVTSGGSSYIYEYDNKNNPWKNIPGMAAINITDHEVMGALNNVTSMEVTGAPGFMATYTYTYNSNNYPTLSIEDYDGEIITTAYIYE